MEFNHRFESRARPEGRRPLVEVTVLGVLLCLGLSTARAHEVSPIANSSRWSLSVDSFFSGPGTGPPLGQPTDHTSGPADTGLNFFNYVSLRYRINDSVTLDIQSNHQWVLTRGQELRNQGIFVGIGGTLLEGEHWTLSGAFNTPIPWGPLLGQINSERTLVFAPGLFAVHEYRFESSRWSLFTLLTPRYLIYRDREAVSRQDAQLGGTQVKPEYGLAMNPTVNFTVRPDLDIRGGLTLEFLKNIGWERIQRNFMPIELGIVWRFHPRWSVYSFFSVSPPYDDGLRRQQGFGSSHWTDTLFVGLWLRGGFDL